MKVMSCVLLLTRDPSTDTLAEHALSASGQEVITALSGDAAAVDIAIGEQEVKEFFDWFRGSNGSHPVVLSTPAEARSLADLFAVDRR